MTSPSPTLPNDPAPSPSGQLRVEVPHWSAQLTVFNSTGQAVLRPDQLLVQPATDLGANFALISDLLPGVYEVQLLLNGQTAHQLAIVRPSETCLLAQTGWELTPTKLESAMPLADFTNASTAQSRAASTWSRKLTAKKSVGTSRLFLFVRTLTPKEGSRFYENLSLLDENEKVVTDFAEDIQINEKEGWLAFTANLPAGYYLIKRHRYDQHRSKFQPVYLAPDYETQVFLMAGKRPSLQTLVLNMTPTGNGFRPDDERTKATVLLTSSLGQSVNPGRLILADAVSRFLGYEPDSPWLSVLCAYAIRLQQDQLVTSDAPAAVWPALLKTWPILMDTLKSFDTHPDVQALQLTLTEPAAQPVRYPPLLFAGLRRVQQHSLHFADTIRIDSLLKRVLPRVSTTSAWTAWRQTQAPAQAPTRKLTPAFTEGVMADEAESVRTVVSTPNYLRFVTPKLPIYQIQSSADVAQNDQSGLTQAAPSMSNVLLTVQTLQATQSLFGDALDSMAVTTALGSKSDIATLFGSEQASGISQLSGVPLAQVQSSLNKLQVACRQPAYAENTLTPYDRTVFSYAVQQVVEGMIGDPLLTTIEDCVNKLLTEANRLSGQFLNSPIPPDIETLAGRIRAVADRLLVSARYMIATDTDGKIVLSNGVFVILLKNQPNVDALLHWQTFLKTAPFGNSTLPYEYVNRGPDAWQLQRTVLHDDDDWHGQVLYLNTFQNMAGLIIKTNQLEQLEALLPGMALATASIAYGQSSEELTRTPDDSLSHQQKLGLILTQMEQILDSPIAATQIS